MKNIFLHLVLLVVSQLFFPFSLNSQWIQTNGPYGGDIISLAASPDGVSGMNLFAGTDGSIFLSTNNGTSWTTVNSGLVVNYIWSLVVSPDGAGGINLFAGTNYGVWRRPLAEIITGVEDIPNQTPAQFVLKQNYPNPFNPITTIEFTVETYNHTSLQIYDLLGRDVATLVNERKSAGTYTVQWDASQVPSGVYFYRIQAGKFKQTKKMILLK